MLNLGCSCFGRSCCPYRGKRIVFREGKHIFKARVCVCLSRLSMHHTCSYKAWISCWQSAAATPHVQCLCWLAGAWTWSFGWLRMAEGVQSWSCNGYHGDALSCIKKTEHCKLRQKALAPLLTKRSQSLVPKDMYESSVINIQGTQQAVLCIRAMQPFSRVCTAKVIKHKYSRVLYIYIYIYIYIYVCIYIYIYIYIYMYIYIYTVTCKDAVMTGYRQCQWIDICCVSIQRPHSAEDLVYAVNDSCIPQQPRTPRGPKTRLPGLPIESPACPAVTAVA